MTIAKLKPIIIFCIICIFYLKLINNLVLSCCSQQCNGWQCNDCSTIGCGKCSNSGCANYPSCNGQGRACSHTCPTDNTESCDWRCAPCGNAGTCPPHQPPPPPLPPPTNPPPPPPSPTPTKTPTPTITPTPTPTIIYITATPTPANSQQNSSDHPQIPGYVWICLSSQTYNGTEYGGTKDHKLKLTGTLPDSFNKDVYIVSCVEISSTVYCTTGNSSLDNRLNLNKANSHTFEVFYPTNPTRILATAQQQLTAYVRSTTQQAIIHKFFAVYQTTTGQQGNPNAGLQQAELLFSSSAETECVLIKWDPHGKVLDYQINQPISNIKLTLVDKKGNKVKEPGLKNPQFTNEKGEFNFYVSNNQSSNYQIKIDFPETYKIEDKIDLEKIEKTFGKKILVYQKNKEYRFDEQRPILIFLKRKNSFEILFDKIWLAIKRFL